MTFAEKFGTVEEYNKQNARDRLRLIETDGYKYYAERYYKHIDLLTYPEIYMTDAEKEEKKKALAHIEKLKRIIDGTETEIDPVIVMGWNYLKDTEYPSWREQGGRHYGI